MYKKAFDSIKSTFFFIVWTLSKNDILAGDIGRELERAFTVTRAVSFVLREIVFLVKNEHNVPCSMYLLTLVGIGLILKKL